MCEGDAFSSPARMLHLDSAAPGPALPARQLHFGQHEREGAELIRSLPTPLAEAMQAVLAAFRVQLLGSKVLRRSWWSRPWSVVIVRGREQV